MNSEKILKIADQCFGRHHYDVANENWIKFARAILQAATREVPSADAELAITDAVAKELWLVWDAASASSWENVANKEKYRYPARKAIEAALGWKPRSEWTIGRDEMNAPTRNAPQLAEGWVLTETKNLNGLIIAMERADSKGYMPDAIQSAWDDFMCQPHIAAAPKGDGNDCT